VPIAVVRPENPKNSKVLTFSAHILILDPCAFDLSPTYRDEVSDDATCHLCAAGFCHGTVPLTSVDATGQQRRFRAYWRQLSQDRKPGRPPVAKEIRELIRRMSHANPTWGSPRIVGELRKLGIDVAKSTVEKYRVRLRTPPSPTWKAFLQNHRQDLVARDFFTVSTATFRVLFVLVILAHKG
jgi:hypothetical protein